MNDRTGNSDIDQDQDGQKSQQGDLRGQQSDYGTSERGGNVTTGTTGGLGSEDDDELVRSRSGSSSDRDDIDESDESP